nr:HAD-IA family hydrolase [Paracoccus sp. S1E-3]
MIVFDVDGTLVDSQSLIVGAMAQAMEGAGLPVLDRARVLSIVGLSLPVAVATLLPNEPEARHHEVVAGYRAAFLSRRLADEAPLYLGARACLDTLGQRDDLMLGIATGKARRGLDAMLDHHQLRGRFVTLQTADNHPSKPHPAMLLAACDEAGVDPAGAVMIGDTSFDMQMALNARTAALGVGWGYHGAPALDELGVAVAGDFGQLQTMIEEWAR